MTLDLNSLQERNRTILAERLHWPDGALGNVRRLETEHPAYTVYWSQGRLQTMHGEGYYAHRAERRWDDPTLYAATPEELSAILTEDAKRYTERW